MNYKNDKRKTLAISIKVTNLRKHEQVRQQQQQKNKSIRVLLYNEAIDRFGLLTIKKQTNKKNTNIKA